MRDEFIDEKYLFARSLYIYTVLRKYLNISNFRLRTNVQLSGE